MKSGESAPSIALARNFVEHRGTGFAGPLVLPPVRRKALRHEVRKPGGDKLLL